MFERIVVPVDGSEHALQAVDAAVDLAGKYDSQIYLVNVSRRAKYTGDIDKFAQSEYRQAGSSFVTDELAKNILENARTRARQGGKSDPKFELREGNVARSVVDFAKEVKADCIIMGSRGLGDIDSMLLGSVSHKVSSLAPCTVVVVR
ncbi:MAG: universal stress protein [Pseudomonadota bacterium]